MSIPICRWAADLGIGTSFFKQDFVVPISSSASPSAWGRRGVAFRYFVPMDSRNCLKATELNGGPLSELSISGNPVAANICLSAAMFCGASVDCTNVTMGHREYASISTSRIYDWYDAWSTWTRSQGREAGGQG